MCRPEGSVGCSLITLYFILQSVVSLLNLEFASFASLGGQATMLLLLPHFQVLRV